jgi:AcrR family transcriptional regulator
MGAAVSMATRARGDRRLPSRGRPPAQPARDVRRALLVAARELFLERSYRDVSVRQLAAAAGVNLAMVRYYFGDKQGLYAAMLQDVMGPLAARIESMLAAPASESPDLAGFLRQYMQTAAENPWLPRLILRDVLAPDGGFRDRFVEEFAGRLAPRVALLVGRGRPGGPTARARLDPRLTVISMLSLGLWPFLAMPVLERALGFRPDAPGIERLIDHTVQFFLAGTTAGAKT